MVEVCLACEIFSPSFSHVYLMLNNRLLAMLHCLFLDIDFFMDIVGASCFRETLPTRFWFACF